jgi:hypothetical protein
MAGLPTARPTFALFACQQRHYEERRNTDSDAQQASFRSTFMQKGIDRINRHVCSQREKTNSNDS